MRSLARRLAAFTAFGIATGAAVGFVLDQVAAGICIFAACGILFGYFAAQ
jgi:hypothetical protein